MYHSEDIDLNQRYKPCLRTKISMAAEHSLSAKSAEKRFQKNF